MQFLKKSLRTVKEQILAPSLLVMTSIRFFLLQAKQINHTFRCGGLDIEGLFTKGMSRASSTIKEKA